MSIATDVKVLNLEQRVKTLESVVADLRALIEKPTSAPEVPRGTENPKDKRSRAS